MTMNARLRSLFLFSLFALVATTALAKDDKGKFLTRSIYVPVRFELCEHLENAILYEGEQPVSLMPAKRIFQFTYYPRLGRIEPAKTDVRVEGMRTNGEEFIGRLAVTPWGIYTANQQIDLDLNKQLARMKYKLDVRYKTRTLTLRCSDSCSLESRPEAVTADAGTTSSP
ncbi:MAG: hypothetical protein BMS9Abin37_2003 [Acidobacteriota bacterium]|nr:MAG: hypothetical protein BMS9Abin37_2003 [Acidobacteriota bacterium]